MNEMNMTSMSGFYGGSDNPCILGFTNGTYPNGTKGLGKFAFGKYVPTSAEKSPCQNMNDPWMLSGKYGLWTQYFYLAIFFVVAIVSAVKRLDGLNRLTSLPSPITFHPRLTALFRATSYPQPNRFMPSFGPAILTVAFTLFATLINFAIRPYYRPPNFGAPPIGLRSEWVATAMVVWIFAFATKRNPLSYLSGISLSRLMVLHKLSPWICLYFSIVHTVAMIIRVNDQQPWWYTWQTNSSYGWPAWAALAALAWLCVMSIGLVRRLAYELFYVFHMITAMLFLVTMYIHLAKALTSWEHMHAATGVFGLAVLYRMGAVAYFHRFFTRIPSASLSSLPGGAVQITVTVPRSRTWTPGQHVFLRFLSLRPWETHPFTIASLPVPAGKLADVGEVQGETHDMVFVLKPQSGLTARLATLAATNRSSRVLVDGPYGDTELIRACDRVLLVCGGAGMSFIAPIILSLARAMADPTRDPLGCVCAAVELVWVAKEEACFEWYGHMIDEALAQAPEGSFKVTTYATCCCAASGVKCTCKTCGGVVEDDDDDEKDVSIKGDGEQLAKVVPKRSFGRPAVKKALHKAVMGTTGRLGVVSCGPSSLLLDTRNAVAAAQWDIVRGSFGAGAGASEIELHEESFDM